MSIPFLHTAVMMLDTRDDLFEITLTSAICKSRQLLFF